MATTTENWLSPLNKLLFRKAFLTKSKQVTLTDGRKFNLDYTRIRGKVLVTPAGNKAAELVPRGWFDLKTVTHKEWLSE